MASRQAIILGPFGSTETNQTGTRQATTAGVFVNESAADIFVPPPPPGNKGGGGDNGNGKNKGKGNDKPGSNSRFDPYGRFVTYHAWLKETSHLHRRRLCAIAPFSVAAIAAGGMHAMECGAPDAYAIYALHPIEYGISA